MIPAVIIGVIGDLVFLWLWRRERRLRLAAEKRLRAMGWPDV